ncbi:MAG: hypothetical protein LH650_06785 [Chloroflexi bacterium]|nr:hypothetical protein [Chloroflexota bacterium]
MSMDPTERLEQLRREVAAETPQPSRPIPAAAPRPIPAPAPPPIPPAAPTRVPVSVPGPRPRPAPGSSTEGKDPRPDTTSDGWDLQDLFADTSLTTWLGVGLLAAGGYMVLSWFVPGIDLIGSLILLGAGVVLLVQHLQRDAGAWALYAGALLTGMGAGRAIGDVLPGSPHGLTAIGVGVAFLAIGYLRHTQAGGYGWQGGLGAAALALGVIQFLLGLLPGSPGVIDLILPALLLIGGGLLIARARNRAPRA